VARPTVAKAPSRIPQGVQLDIIALAVLTSRLLEIRGAIKSTRKRLAGKLTGDVRMVRS
jgi:hypothetical protein